jgi:hypothetical protein
LYCIDAAKYSTVQQRAPRIHRHGTSRKPLDRDFLRQVPNALLGGLCSRGDFHDLNCGAINETRLKEFFAVWAELPDGRRAPTEAELREIKDRPL